MPRPFQPSVNLRTNFTASPAEPPSAQALLLTATVHRFLRTGCCVIVLMGVLSSSGTAEDKAAAKDVPQTMAGLPLVFHDDFESGRDRWWTTDDAAWSLHTTDSGQAFGLDQRVSDYQPKVRSPHNIALIKDVEVADFVLTFDVRSTKDTGNHRDCCVFFNYQDATHFYYVHCGQRPDPHSGQIMIVNDAPRKALTDNKNNTPWDDDWHQVKLVRDTKTGRITIYFDDMQKPHMTVVDKTFGRGRVGMGSFDDMNDFDNVRLYGR